MDRRIATCFASLFATLTLTLPSIAAVRDAETIAVGAGVQAGAVDKTSGRLFTANAGGFRGSEGSISVLNLDGTVNTLTSVGTPLDVAVSSALRKVVVTHPGADRVSIIDADTLAMTIVATGTSPTDAVIVDSKNRAYITGRNNRGGELPYQSGVINGSVTEVDLSTGATRIFQMPDMQPLAITAVGGRVFVTAQSYGFAQVLPSFIRELDTSSGTFGAPVAVGRGALDLLASASGDEIYVLGHADFMRDTPSVRAALFVLDTSTLATKRTILLPDFIAVTHMADGTPVYNLPNIMGALTLDAQTGNVYALDMFNKRFSIVNPATGALTAVDLEFSARSIAFEPVSRSLYVGFSYGGYAAVYSAGGERLDTLSVGESQPGSLVALNIAVNSLSGAAYAINTGPGTVSILRTPDTVAAQAFNATDLWWNANESGWGIYLEQQGTTMFGALFLRDEAGAPRWYVMSEGKRAGNGSFSGTLYRMQGPAGASAHAAAVGTLTFAPDSNDSASLSYTIGDAKRSTVITRTVFASDRSCGWSNSADTKAAHLPNYTALYYQPENTGWGLAVSQRGDTAFGVIYGYDAAQQPTWTVMSDGKAAAKSSGSAFGGALYRVAGNSVAEIGSMSLAFGADGAASLAYTADGKSTSLALERHVFGAITSDCGM